MKMVNAKIDMIAVFHRDEPPEPVRSCYDKEGREYVIKVDRVVDLKKHQYGNTCDYIYRCQSLIGRRERIYELKYIGRDVRWIPHKI